jgi:uncharacterized protein YndB with AHSA1/START domain/DNA-binding transcriptional ArsR family regulator
MDGAFLAALAEPNRLRIVELLNVAPRAVGEIASKLDLRQPQVTKHLQALERAGLVAVHPLGQRRIYALRREPLRELRGWLEAFTPDHPSEAVLDQYHAAIERERASATAARRTRLTRTLHASPKSVWAHWTSADLMRRWWSPEHFSVAECEANPVPGGSLRIIMEEGDGTRHPAAGHYLALSPPDALSFELAPLGPDKRPLFSALHRVRLTERGANTKLSLTITVTNVTPGAAPALAGVRLGWAQLLNKLAYELAAAAVVRRRRLNTGGETGQE